MKLYFKFICLFVIFMLALATCNNGLANNIKNQSREKSQVLLIINNIAHSKHDKVLNKLMNERLQEKIEVIYRQENNKPYFDSFIGQENSILSLDEILEKVKKSKSDYLVYAELKQINKDTDFNLIYHGKEVSVTFYLRIVDIKNRKDLYSSEYSLMAKDSTDYFFVGSSSVAKKALEKVLFRAGEAISTYLPL